MKNKKFIIWGHPLHSHTHSYIHGAIYKALKHMNFDVYWFHKGDYPKDFDYNNCIFWTEGYDDDKIPINESSIYFVHFGKDPKKYLSKGARFIDVRFNELKKVGCGTYDYNMEDLKLKKISDATFYNTVLNGDGLNQKFKSKCNNTSYEAIYVTWATDLLPEEFPEEPVNNESKEVHWIGTLSHSGYFQNMSNVQPFKQACGDNGIIFKHNDPWRKPISYNETMKRVKDSVIAPDIRSKAHVDNGYIPCRIMKNVSYGHYGITNSQRAYNFFGGEIQYQPDTYQMFYDCMDNRKKFNKIKTQMKLIKEKHTYLNRIKDIMEIL